MVTSLRRHLPSPGILAAFAAVYLIWGSTYLTIRIAIETLPPLLMAGTRFLLAGVILYAISRRPGIRKERLTLAQWRAALVIGACLLFAGNGAVTWGEQYVASGLVALIVATVPLWVAVFGPLFGAKRIGRLEVAGIAVGLVGVGLLLRPGGSVHPQALLVVGSSMLWAVGSLYAGRAPTPSSPVTAVGMEMIAGGLMLTIAGLASGELHAVHLENVSVASAIAFGYLTLVGAIVGYGAYIWLLRKVPAPAAATYAFVNPLVAVALGAIVLSEPITPATLVAGGLIIIAVATILTSQGRAAGASRRAGRTAQPPTPVSEVA
jgi:drug/metabolite transporter (DMT)-like permease